jgi:hypothetical protein
VVAFDNRAGFSALPGWLSIDLGQERTVVFYAISMYFYTNFTTQTPNTWFLEGSNDNANWTILDSQSGQVGWSEYETRNFPVASPGSYRYYRIRVTTNNGDAFTPVGELYLFEWATPVPQYPDPSQVLLGIVYAYGALAGTMVQTSDRPVPVDHLMPPATKNVAYSETISARYGTAPCTFAVTVGDLPPGLSLDPETGIVSGTPTTTGAYEFTVTATDAEASEGSSAFSITVSEPAAGCGNSCF